MPTFYVPVPNWNMTGGWKSEICSLFADITKPEIIVVQSSQLKTFIFSTCVFVLSGTFRLRCDNVLYQREMNVKYDREM